MDCTILACTIMFIFIGIIVADIGSRSERNKWINERTKEPYCEISIIRDQEYERCWKVIEVKPEKLRATTTGEPHES